MNTHEHEERADHKGRGRPVKGPTRNPSDLSEQMVAETLRNRRSKCSAGNCGSDGGCSTGGCGVGSIVDQIARAFDYTDERGIVEIEYKGFDRDFATLPEGSTRPRVGDRVIVQNRNGVHWAVVNMVGSLVHAKRKAKRLSNEEIPLILRFADESDLKKIDACLASERQAYSVCRTRIEAFELPMDLVEAEWQFDHRKLTFYFTADGRVDFRALVRDLAAIFNTRIELRQIPVRDAAKRLGGMGVCGRELCCSTHLGQYEHITLDHARIQQIPANPSKLSGPCGRLKCCLLYEIDTYVEGMKRFPPLESTITTARGTGVLQKIDLFRESLYVHHPGESEWEMLTLAEYNNLLENPPAQNGVSVRREASHNSPADGAGTGDGSRESGTSVDDQAKRAARGSRTRRKGKKRGKGGSEKAGGV